MCVRPDTTAGRSFLRKPEKSRRRQRLRCASARRSPGAHENLAGLFCQNNRFELKKKACRGSCGRARAVPGGRGRRIAAVCQGTGRNRERDDTGKCVPQTAGDFPLAAGNLDGGKTARSSKNTKQNLEGCRRNMLLRSMYIRSGHFYRRLLQRAWQSARPKQQTAPEQPFVLGPKPV